MHICEVNPQLLNNEWALFLIERLHNRKNIEGKTALMIFFESRKAIKADLNSVALRELMQKEINAKDSQ